MKQLTKCQRTEILRPWKTCVVCKIIKQIKAYGHCQACWHHYKRQNQPEFYLRNKWTELKPRCTNKNKPKVSRDIYYGMPYCTIEEFLNKFKEDNNYLTLFKNWQLNKFNIKYSPSIDRINSSKGYEIYNLQFLTHSQNSLKANEPAFTPVHIYKKTGEYVGHFKSQSEASRALNIIQSNLWKVLNKERKTVSGYKASYA